MHTFLRKAFIGYLKYVIQRLQSSPCPNNSMNKSYKCQLKQEIAVDSGSNSGRFNTNITIYSILVSSNIVVD